MRVILAALTLAVACALPVSDAAAGWGCGFRFSGLPAGRNGSVWGMATAEDARRAAMRLCQQTETGCYIVSCHANVDTEGDAYAIWPLGARKKNCFGTGCDN